MVKYVREEQVNQQYELNSMMNKYEFMAEFMGVIPGSDDEVVERTSLIDRIYIGLCNEEANNED